MATYEGKWRCLQCSTANLGRNLNCLMCGVKRGDDVEFYLEDDAAVCADENLLQQAHAGADWICRYCSGNNRAMVVQCSSCGSGRSDKDAQLIEETRGVGEWSEQARSNAFTADQTNDFPPPSPPKSFLSSRLVKFGLLGAGGLAALIIAFFGVLIYIGAASYSTEVEVTGLEWTRSIALEEYKTVNEKGLGKAKFRRTPAFNRTSVPCITLTKFRTARAAFPKPTPKKFPTARNATSAARRARRTVFLKINTARARNIKPSRKLATKPKPFTKTFRFIKFAITT